MFPGFVTNDADVNGTRIHCRVGGSGPALLLLHGNPLTHVMWHRIAPRLAQDFTVVAADLRRATSVFEDYVGRTLQIDLNDLSRDRWSLEPSSGDFIAEVRTQKLGSLTYARSSTDAEDISFFDRKRRKNIAVYASEEKLKARGRFYNEDDLLDYDILAYDLDAAFSPDREWIDGDARVKIKIRDRGTTSLTMKLADSLALRGVYSPAFGRLLYLRVVGQNSIILNLPEPLPVGEELWIRVVYSGRIPA